MITLTSHTSYDDLELLGNAVAFEPQLQYNMSQCQLKEVDFTETNLSKTDCRGSDFTGARCVNTNLTHADLRKAVGYAIHPEGNILRKTKFSLPEAILLLDAFDIVLE